MSDALIDVPIELLHGSPVPLYHQLARQLEAAVADGRLPKGVFLGNELDLAAGWRVSRPTVRRAIQELVERGLLVRRRGVGTQVVSDRVRRPVRLSSLYDDLAEQGRAPHTEVVLHEVIGADAAVAEALALLPGTPVLHIERVRSAGRTRLALMRNWLPAAIAAGFGADALAEQGLYALLGAVGVRPKVATQHIGAAAADAHVARHLGVERGAPLLTMRRVMHDDRGRAIELGDHCYDAAHYSLEMTVTEG